MDLATKIILTTWSAQRPHILPKSDLMEAESKEDYGEPIIIATSMGHEFKIYLIPTDEPKPHEFNDDYTAQVAGPLVAQVGIPQVWNNAFFATIIIHDDGVLVAFHRVSVLPANLYNDFLKKCEDRAFFVAIQFVQSA